MAHRVPPWPETIGTGDVEYEGKPLSVEIHTASLGIDFNPDEPNTEYRQVEIHFNGGDATGFRFIAVGVPLRTRGNDPHTFVQPYEGGEIILAICWTRLRYLDWPVSHLTVIQPDGSLHSDRLPDPGGSYTKAQGRKIDQGLRLVEAIRRGRLTLRGAPAGSPGPRKYKNERAFRRALGAGIVDVCRDLLTRGVTVWALEDEVTKSAVAQKMNISRPTLDGYLKDHPSVDFKKAVGKVVAALLKAVAPPLRKGHPNSFLHAPGRTRANHVAST